MFIRNRRVSVDAPYSLIETNISEGSSHVLAMYPDCELGNNAELGGRTRATWGSFKSVEEIVIKATNVRVCVRLFDPTVVPVPGTLQR